MEVFPNRTEAGRLLGRVLQARRYPDAVVLALPRGGVPVAVEVARALQAPLDLLIARKIGAPGHRELAVAAIAEGAREAVIDRDTLEMTGADQAYVDAQAREEIQEIARRRSMYLQGQSPMPVEGRTVIVVDDGLATGTTARAAVQALRVRKPARIVLAVPVAPREAVELLRPQVEDIVCLTQPPFFHAVGLHYADFHQVEDAEVIAGLEQARASAREASRAEPAAPDSARATLMARARPRS